MKTLKHFGRIDTDGNVAVLMSNDGSCATRIDANVYPVGSTLSARYEHPEGIIISLVDAINIGLEIHYN